jgi:ribosomal protein S16
MDREAALIDYANKTLGWYFDGDFYSAVSECEMDLEEIQKWASIGALYDETVEHSLLSPEDADAAFSVLECLYIFCEVDLEMKGRFGKPDLQELLEPFDLPAERCLGILEKGYELLARHGLSLHRLVVAGAFNKAKQAGTR